MNIRVYLYIIDTYQR